MVTFWGKEHVFVVITKILAKNCHFGCPLVSVRPYKNLNKIRPLITLAEGVSVWGGSLWVVEDTKSPQKFTYTQWNPIFGPILDPTSPKYKIWDILASNKDKSPTTNLEHIKWPHLGGRAWFQSRIFFRYQNIFSGTKEKISVRFFLHHTD